MGIRLTDAVRDRISQIRPMMSAEDAGTLRDAITFSLNMLDENIENLFVRLPTDTTGEPLRIGDRLLPLDAPEDSDDFIEIRQLVIKGDGWYAVDQHGHRYPTKMVDDGE
jgi:hypothetical protein